MGPIVPRHKLGKAGMLKPQSVTLLGVELSDAREEVFVRMVCDGLALGTAFARAGFTSRRNDAPGLLFALPRIQERANAILEARRTTGVVTLPEVTEMLKRVFAGAHSEGEYSAAHSAAFSLARLYGHVTDRAIVDVRKPSREPDAPSEQALEAWVRDLPGPVIEALPGPGPEALGPGPAGEAGEGRIFGAPAGPQTQDPTPGPDFLSVFNDLHGVNRNAREALTAGPQGPGPEKPNEINGLGAGPGPGRPENGAPSGPVTGTPNGGARSARQASKAHQPPTPRPKKRVLRPRVQVPVKKRGRTVKTGKILPSAKDLFG